MTPGEMFSILISITIFIPYLSASRTDQNLTLSKLQGFKIATWGAAEYHFITSLVFFKDQVLF